MRLSLVGADFEENLGLGMIAACAQEAGHAVLVHPFNEPRQVREIARRIAAARPDLVGLSLQFQHRGHEFVALARALREEGYAGHLTCGGMLASAAWREVLSEKAFDSVVLYEGERTLVELAGALEARRPLAEVPGLALRGPGGEAVRTADRERPCDLDALPFPARYRPATRHLGIPFLPILGSRGCWGRCAFCSISSFHLDARAHGGGRLLRLRSPESIAREMAQLAGDGPALFCFHDDNFLLPRAEESLERVRAIRAAFDRLAPGPVGIIGKTRPECLSVELAKELRRLGVVRLYVGIENTSERGAEHLARRVQARHVRPALAACREAGIFACYNLLVFEPKASLADVRENVAFMREQATHPVNFCRAEAYTGTPLHRALASRDALTGSWLGWNYRLEDDRAELLFRVCSAAFRERNFGSDGVANRSMGLGYCAKILESFYPQAEAEVRRLSRRAEDLTRSIVLETAGFLEEAVALAEASPPSERDALERQTVLLGLRISQADQAWHAAMDEFHAEADRLVASQAASRPRPATWRRAAQRVALGATLALGGTPACVCYSVDMVPADPDAMVVDPLPPDAGSASDATVADPLPPDAGSPDAGLVADPLPEDAGMVADPVPEDAGMVVDPAPEDGGIASREPAGQWRDSATCALRSADLPLFDPPRVRLCASRDGELVRVTLVPSAGFGAVRWEAEGHLDGEGREVCWSPASPEDSLRVAVRTAGGVAVVSLRARDVKA